MNLLKHVKPNKDCTQGCDNITDNNYVCFECEEIQVREKYPNAIYNSEYFRHKRTPTSESHRLRRKSQAQARLQFLNRFTHSNYSCVQLKHDSMCFSMT
jgi:hypothetical protein